MQIFIWEYTYLFYNIHSSIVIVFLRSSLELQYMAPVHDVNLWNGKVCYIEAFTPWLGEMILSFVNNENLFSKPSCMYVNDTTLLGLVNCKDRAAFGEWCDLLGVLFIIIKTITIWMNVSLNLQWNLLQYLRFMQRISQGHV